MKQKPVSTMNFAICKRRLASFEEPLSKGGGFFGFKARRELRRKRISGEEGIFQFLFSFLASFVPLRLCVRSFAGIFWRRSHAETQEFVEKLHREPTVSP